MGPLVILIKFLNCSVRNPHGFPWYSDKILELPCQESPWGSLGILIITTVLYQAHVGLPVGPVWGFTQTGA